MFCTPQSGVFIPGDGVVNPTDVTMAMAKKAKEMGWLSIFLLACVDSSMLGVFLVLQAFKWWRGARSMKCYWKKAGWLA